MLENILLEKIEQLEKELERTKESCGKFVIVKSNFAITPDGAIIGGWTIPKPLPPEIDKRILPHPRLELRHTKGFPGKLQTTWTMCLLYKLQDGTENVVELGYEYAEQNFGESFVLPKTSVRDIAYIAKELKIPAYVPGKKEWYTVYLDDNGEAVAQLYDVRSIAGSCMHPFCGC
jgi:hypothetical protein